MQFDDPIGYESERRSSNNRMSLYRTLISHAWPTSFDLLGHHLSLEIVPNAGDIQVASWLVMRLDEDRCWLGLGPIMTAFLSRPFGQLPGDDDPVSALCAAYAFDEVFSALEGTACNECSVMSWGRRTPEETASSEVTFNVTFDDGTTEATTVHVTPGAEMRLSQALGTRPVQGARDASTPITGKVSLARITLPKSSLGNLKVGSAILLGRAYANRQHGTLKIANSQAPCRMDHGQLTVTSDFVDDVDDQFDQDPSPSEQSDTDVHIDVVLAQIEISPDDLSPGGIIGLPESLSQHVTMMVKDQPLVKGRIINVNGALAVQIEDGIDGSS